MKKILKNNFVKISLLTTLMLVLSFSYLNAAQVQIKKDYTEEYKKWLELPENERKDYIEPSKYSINFSNKKDENRLFALKSSLESKYSLKSDINVKVKNQQDTSSCWAFSTTTVLETNIAKTQGRNFEFSPRHMEYATSRVFRDGINTNGYNREVGDGGNPRIALAYVTAGFGPILEKDMPFENNNNKINLSEIQNKNVPVQIEEYIDLPSLCKEYNADGTVKKYTNGYDESSSSRIEYTEAQVEEIRNQIKNHIVKYGAISTKTYMQNDRFLNKVDSTYEYYCNSNNYIANHAVTIVGWDDNYKKENFSSLYGKPSHDGAYLILNSWGSSWGEKGYYYVSYDDAIIERTLYGVTKIKDKTYDNIYQHDILGSNQIIGYNSINSAYIGNVFTKKESGIYEKLEEVSFQLYTKSNVKVYVNTNSGDLNINNLTYLGELYNLNSGYHTFKLDNPILIEGNKYAVVLKVTNINSSWIYFLGEAKDSEGIFSTAAVGQNESFSSPNGVNWEDVGTKGVNYTIKAFTKIDSNIKNIQSASVEGYNNEYLYTGNAIRPMVRVKYANNYLAENIDYTVNYQNNVNAGIAIITINGKGNFIGTINRTFIINKVDNTAYIKGKNKTIKYKKVKKKKQKVSAITIYNPEGTVTYSKKSGNKNFSISKTSGKITVKKKTRKGTYKIKVKVKVAGNSNYYSTSKTITIKIKIK